MLKNELWFRYSDGLEVEMIKAQEEGKNISEFIEKVKSIMALEDMNP